MVISTWHDYLNTFLEYDILKQAGSKQTNKQKSVLEKKEKRQRDTGKVRL